MATKGTVSGVIANMVTLTVFMCRCLKVHVD